MITHAGYTMNDPPHPQSRRQVHFAVLSSDAEYPENWGDGVGFKVDGIAYAGDDTSDTDGSQWRGGESGAGEGSMLDAETGESVWSMGIDGAGHSDRATP